MNFLILIVLCVVSFLFIFPDRFGRKRFENWILSRPKPYAFNVLYFSLVGWGGYSVYKDIKGEEIRWFGDFFEYFPLTFLLLLYLTGLAFKRLEIDKKDKSNRIDYFKNKQQQQKEWIGKSMWIHPQSDYQARWSVIACGVKLSMIMYSLPRKRKLFVIQFKLDTIFHVLGS